VKGLHAISRTLLEAALFPGRPKDANDEFSDLAAAGVASIGCLPAFFRTLHTLQVQPVRQGIAQDLVTVGEAVFH
jgi:hypothetical protein